MRIPVVLMVIGADRPGLVDLVSTTVAQHDGNWLESRLAHLGGHFAGVVRADIPAERERALSEALRALASQGITVVFHQDAPPPTSGEGAPATLELLGHDRPGIVRQIAGALSRQGVNVEELETHTESAPMTGDTLFRARATLRVPPACSFATLQSELERIAADLMVDVTLTASADPGGRTSNAELPSSK